MEALQTRTDLRVPSTDLGADAVMGLVRTVEDALEMSTATTLEGLRETMEEVMAAPRFDNLRSASDVLRHRLLSCGSGRQSIAELRRAMTRHCQEYLTRSLTVNDAIVNYVLPFIRDTSVVIAHGSGAVLAHCVASSLVFRRGVRFLIVAGAPLHTGEELVSRIRQHPKIAQLELEQGAEQFEWFFSRSVTVVPDSCVATLAAEADLVLSGAYAVTEHGGLVHGVGSYQLGLVANALSVPFYVLCESFKFSALFPLSTKDLYTDIAANRRGLRSALSASTLPESGGHGGPSDTPSASNASSPTRPGKVLSALGGGGRSGSFGAVSSLGDETAASRAPVMLLPVELVPPKLVALVVSEDGIMPPSAVADQMLMARREIATAASTRARVGGPTEISP